VAPNAGERVIGKPKLQSLGVKFRDKLDDIEDPNFRCDNDSRRFVALVPSLKADFVSFATGDTKSPLASRVGSTPLVGRITQFENVAACMGTIHSKLPCEFLYRDEFVAWHEHLEKAIIPRVALRDAASWLLKDERVNAK